MKVKCTALYVTCFSLSCPYDALLQTQSPTECSIVWKQLGNAIDTTYDYFAMAADRMVVAVCRDDFVHVFSFDEESDMWVLMGDPIIHAQEIPSFRMSVGQNYYTNIRSFPSHSLFSLKVELIRSCVRLLVGQPGMTIFIMKNPFVIHRFSQCLIFFENKEGPPGHCEMPGNRCDDSTDIL